MRLLALLMVFSVGYCQVEQQGDQFAAALVLSTAQDEDGEFLSRLKAIVEQERGIPRLSLQQLCKKHGFSVLSSPSRKDVVYILSSRILRNSATALQQVFQLLEAGTPVNLVQGSPAYESLKLALRANEFVRFRNLDTFLQRYDYAAIMLSGEIVAMVTINGDTYRFDVGQLYEVREDMFPSENSPRVDAYERQKTQDIQNNDRNSTWLIHFVGWIPFTDRERSEMVVEAFTLVQRSIENEARMYQEVIQFVTQQMEQQLRDRESLEVGYSYSIESLSERWQAALRHAATESGLKWESIRNARVQFSVVPGLQFLLQSGDKRQVFGFRLTETRVFSYHIDGAGASKEN